LRRDGSPQAATQCRGSKHGGPPSSRTRETSGESAGSDDRREAVALPAGESFRSRLIETLEMPPTENEMEPARPFKLLLRDSICADNLKCIGTKCSRRCFADEQAGRVIVMQKNRTTWQTLGKKLRELMPVKAEATDEMQVLVLRLAVKDAERFHDSGMRRASSG
jgi:hypothetical protein